MGVDAFRLFVGQTGYSGVKLLHGDFALINLTWGEGNEQGRVFNAVLSVKGIIGFVPV